MSIDRLRFHGVRGSNIHSETLSIFPQTSGVFAPDDHAYSDAGVHAYKCPGSGSVETHSALKWRRKKTVRGAQEGYTGGSSAWQQESHRATFSEARRTVLYFLSFIFLGVASLRDINKYHGWSEACANFVTSNMYNKRNLSFSRVTYVSEKYIPATSSNEKRLCTRGKCTSFSI